MNLHPSRIILLAIAFVTIVLIVLKAQGIINWKWKWILAPIWGSFVLSLVAMLVVYFVLLIKSK